MLNSKVLPLLTALVLMALSVFGQRFNRVYDCPQNGQNVYDATETTTGFTIHSFRNSGHQFVDMAIDSTGNNPQFEIHNFPLFTLEKSFIRNPDKTVVLFDNTENSSAIIQFLDTSGSVLWSQEHIFTGTPGSVVIGGKLHKGIRLNDGYLFLGHITQALPNGLNVQNLYALKTDWSGNALFQTFNEYPFDLLEFIDQLTISGNRIYFTFINGIADPSDGWITYITDAGDWSPNPKYEPPFNSISGMTANPNGGINVAGLEYGFISPGMPYGSAISLDSNWELRWQRAGWPELDYLCNLEKGGRYQTGVIHTYGTKTVLSGTVQPAGLSPNEASLFLALIDSLGNIITLKTYPYQLGFHGSLNHTQDGGYLYTFYNYLNGGHLGVIKTDSNLIASPNLIYGNVTQDPNLNCLADSSESAMSGWVMALANAQDTVFTFTYPNGSYEFPADTGAHILAVQPYNPYWEPCENNLPLYFPTENIFDTIPFNLQPAVECPQMEVDIALPFTRRCFDNQLFINYCNNGTVAADSASLEVILDPLMSYVSSQVPVSAVHGDTLVFNLGTVDVLECDQFNITIYINCDSSQLGQTVCVSAHIYPDSICLPVPAWSGGQLAVGGYCEQDSVVFWAQNVGIAATQQLDYVIIEDMVVWKEDFFNPLLPGESDTIRVAADGSTYGLLAEQEPGYPYNAFSPLANGPSAWVEACNWSGGGLFPGGFITQFPNEDGNPTTATDCNVLVGSYDPNDKTASPQGVGDKHFILPGTPLEYLIRFQNTGTDTAFRVVIRDQLPPQLDPLTLNVLTGSHPYKVDFEPDNVLKFTFDNILLPDSNVNEAASHGFIKFRIHPKNDLAIGSKIENTAAIFFDFNDPIYTNTCFHTIDTLFMALDPNSIWEPGKPAAIRQKIVPNPVGNQSDIRLAGKETFTGNATIFDNFGRPVSLVLVQQGLAKLPKGILPGTYVLKTADGWVAQLVVI